MIFKFINIFFMLLIACGSAFSQSIDKPEFTWNSSQYGKTYGKVRFENGETVIVVKDQKLPVNSNLKDSCEIQRIEIERKGRREATDMCDSLVFIRAVYPSVENAKVAIVETNCGGTMCSDFSDVYVLFQSAKGVRFARLGTSFSGPKNKPTIYDFWFNKGTIKRSVVRNFFDGHENELGDLLISTRNYDEKGEYLDSRFNKAFKKFIGGHPQDFFGDQEARTGIVKLIKSDEFVEYRNAMSGPGWSKVSHGRFIVLNACMAHACDLIFGSVIIDGFTGDTHLIRFDSVKKIFANVSTKVLDELVDSEWLESVDTQKLATLSIKSGRLIVQKAK